MVFETVIWWVLIEILGIISFPLVFNFCKNLPDKGYSISKIMGILLVSYLSWILGISGLFNYNVTTILIAILIISFLSIFIFYKKKSDIIKFFKEKKRMILLNEIIFTMLFIAFLVIRMYTPDILTLEKFMDFAFINGINRSQHLPPSDPWFSGGTIQYYYLGHFIVTTLTKISGITTNLSYNLAFSMFYALFAYAAFGIGYNLTKKYKYGFITLILVALLGNIFGFIQLLIFLSPNFGNFLAANLALKYPVTCCWDQSLSFSQQITSLDVWASTRIIPDTINEFPYSSFLFGDFHAHYMIFPFQLLILVLMLNLFKSNHKGINFFGESFESKTLNIFLFSLCLGSFFFISSWYYPMYAALFFFVVLFQQFRINNRKMDFILIKNILPPLLIIGLLSILLFLPYHLTNKLHRDIGFVTERTGIQHFLIIFPSFLFVISSLLFLKSKKIIIGQKFKIIIGLFLLAVFSFILNFPLLIILVPLIFLSYFLLSKISQKNENQNLNFVLILIFLASLILLSCEIFFIDGRMNTVFKIYLQAWIFFGIAAGFGLYYLIAHSSLSKYWIIFLCFLLIISLITPIIVTFNHIIHSPYLTLDGLLYMKNMNNGDFEAINWINENIDGLPIILESPGKAYTYYSRVSANTGIPTILGWNNHEFLWRGTWYTDRENDANKIYNTTNNTETLGLLKKYNVTYIYVGQLERRDYSGDGLKKFSENKESYNKVYENYGVTIYQIL